jgi:hypothetical protein
VETLRRELDMQAVLISNERDGSRQVYAADWVLLSTKPITVRAIADAATALSLRPGLRAWTDDYSNLFQIFKMPRKPQPL